MDNLVLAPVFPARAFVIWEYKKFPSNQNILTALFSLGVNKLIKLIAKHYRYQNFVTRSVFMSRSVCHAKSVTHVRRASREVTVS